MTHEFDPGYVREPFGSLCRDYPGAQVYPPADFRIEWGPIFHRGRLDGTARVVVVGQDPAAHESIARRILVGEAGQRIQGFLAKVGLERSYVMVNTFLYSVYGQGGGQRHRDDPAIAAYRNRWLDALITAGQAEAVLTLGQLAAAALVQWRTTPTGSAADLPHVGVLHPTYPESASAHGQTTLAQAMARMLADWNRGLAELASHLRHPDVERDLVPYGERLDERDLAPIPEADLPAGTPEWMRSLEPWADRQGQTPDDKRATIVVRVPSRYRPWSPPIPSPGRRP